MLEKDQVETFLALLRACPNVSEKDLIDKAIELQIPETTLEKAITAYGKERAKLNNLDKGEIMKWMEKEYAQPK